MSSGLETIARELRRLREEGVDRVYVGDETLARLQTRPASHATDAPSPSKSPAASSGSELEQLLKKPTGGSGAAEPRTRAAAPAAAKATAPASIKPLPPEGPDFTLPDGEAASQLAWLQERVENCPACREHLAPEGKIVFGEGPVTADIFFCGEAPGADEEREGRPFVGKAGQLLTKIIQAMGLSRETVYIANILKWRPEHDKPFGNRPPTQEEMAFCLPYLRAQIAIVQPRVIVALGNTAVNGLLGPDPKRRLGDVRGTWQTFEDIPLMVTFHPSYLLRNGTLQTKRTVWEDLLQVMEKTGLPISDKQRSFFLPKD